MITILLSLVGKLVKEYKSKGPSVLINSHLVPEFHKLVQHLSKVTLKHVGITDKNHTEYFKRGTTTYVNIFEQDDFCVGVFCLSKGSTLRLHDHPNMLVLSKFLTGSIHHRSLDLLDRSQQVDLPRLLLQDDAPDVIGRRLEARVRSDRVFLAGEMNYLTPNRGNIHRFTALEDTAILDILLPNYNETDHYCNYYIEMPMEVGLEEKSIWQLDAELNKRQDKDREPMECEKETSKQNEFGYVGSACASVSAHKEYKLKPVGEETILVYALPPLDESISLVTYKGEKFEYDDSKQDI